MKPSVDIKVCGMKYPENIEALCELDVQFIGFIFAGASPRFVGREPDPELFRIPAGRLRRVGVFVDAPQAEVLHQLESDRIDLVQLHGRESRDYCTTLRRQGVEVIRMVDPWSIADPCLWKDHADHLLLDSAGQGKGGSGKKFDWALLERFRCKLPFFLSGGVGPGDASELKSIENERLKGLDLNSRFELAPGMKDLNEIEVFVKQIRDKT